jgi:predicted nucleic acid-binding protein
LIVSTLGFLVRAKEVGLIPKVGPLLDDLAVVDFWMSDSLRERILRAAGEL